MSTNIQIDVVLRKLQEQSEQIKAQNQEQRSEREEEADLAQKKAERERKERLEPADNSELTVSEPGQSPPTGEQLRQKEADSKSKALNSTDPDIARTKEEPAGFVAGGLNLMHCWYQTETAASFAEFRFVTATGVALTVRRNYRSFVETFPFANLETGTAFEGGTLFDYRNGISVNGRQGEVLLPLSNGKFIFAYFNDSVSRGAELFYYGNSSATNAFSNVSESTRSYDVCVLIGPGAIKEIPMPPGLLGALQNLYRLPAVEDITLLFPSSPSTPNTIPVPWLFRPDPDDETVTSYTRQAPLYAHYLGLTNKSAGPAVYWWLQNAIPGEDYFFFTPEQIRETFPDATYGRSRNGGWYQFNLSFEQDKGLGLVWTITPDQFDLFGQDLQSPQLSRSYKNTYATLPADFTLQSTLVAWDGNVGSYCNAQALQLGFRNQDLTF